MNVSESRPQAILVFVAGATILVAFGFWWNAQHTPSATSISASVLQFSDGTPHQRPEFERVAEALAENSIYYQ